MRRIFKIPEIESKFQKDGFCILPYMSDNAIKKLFTDLKNLNPGDGFEGNQKTLIGQQSFHITFFDDDEIYKQAVLKLAEQIFTEFCTTYLDDYVCVQANAIIKPPGKGFVHPHQNLTIVDESNFTSVSLWMPLQDTNASNGTLFVIPGSHEGFEDYRNTHIYWPHIPFFRKEKGLKYFHPINVKAGEILILHDRIVHFTPENSTPKPRWVLHSLWQPKEADTLYFEISNDEVRVYAVDKYFWQTSQPGEGVGNLKPIEIRPNKGRPYSEKELIKMLEALQRD